MNVRGCAHATKRLASRGLSNYLGGIAKHFNDLIAGFLRVPVQDGRNQ
jgi:hypothetical protein